MSNKEIFDRIAAQYDTPDRAHVAKLIAEAIGKELEHSETKSAIDYGCGTGLVGLELLDRFQSVLFVDASPAMVEVLQSKLAQRGISKAKADVLCSDFALEDPGVKADYILLSQVLLHVKDYGSLLERLYSMLNSAGHLIIVDFDKNPSIDSDMVHNGFDQAALIELLKEIGFRAAAAKTFYHGEKIFMGQDASLFLLDGQK